MTKPKEIRVTRNQVNAAKAIVARGEKRGEPVSSAVRKIASVGKSTQTR